MNQARIKKFLEHATQSPMIHTFPSVKNRVMNLPVCPACERVALRDTRKEDPQRGYITCPVCGYHGPTTIMARTYVKEHVMR